MPELPDVEIYREALARRLVGATLSRVELRSPFLLRTRNRRSRRRTAAA